MGAEVSACCGGAGDKDTQLDVAAVPQDASGIRLSPRSLARVRANRRRLEEGLKVTLILQNADRLECEVNHALQKNCLNLFCKPKNKNRGINVGDIRAILHTPQELERIEKAAEVKQQERLCAAIHLANTGNCIPLFFQREEDKDCFVDAMLDILREYRMRLEANRISG